MSSHEYDEYITTEIDNYLKFSGFRRLSHTNVRGLLMDKETGAKFSGIEVDIHEALEDFASVLQQAIPAKFQPQRGWKITAINDPKVKSGFKEFLIARLEAGSNFGCTV